MPMLAAWSGYRARHLPRASAKYADGDHADEIVRRSPMAGGEQTGDRTAGAARLGSPVKQWKPAIT
jgi:hypothetical protein